MKNQMFFLRLCGLLILSYFTLAAEAKECIGTISATLKYADGTVSNLGTFEGMGMEDIPVYLLAGDTIIVQASRHGNCPSQGGLCVQGSTLNDTVDYLSPVINASTPTSSVFKIAQRGSYCAWQTDVDFGPSVRLFIHAEQEPIAVGLIFKWSYFAPDIVPAGDTCTNPCVSAYIQSGQSVRMQPIFGGLAQEGGNVVVRYAPEGEPLDFDSPSTIMPMVGFEGYQFSADGIYLLSVEGPYFTSSAVAFVRVSHLTPPHVDMSLTIERADGSTEEVAYVQPNQVSSNGIFLGPGDSLRIDDHQITEPCNSVRLIAYESSTWGPVNAWNSQLVVDTPSTPAGFRMATPGSYHFSQITDCGIPTSSADLTINAPPPQMDLVISVRHSDGVEEELFRNHIPSEVPPHLVTYLGLGDSIRVHSEQTGWCNGNNIRINRSSGPDDATESDFQLTPAFGTVQDISFSISARYLIRLFTGACSSEQRVHLYISPTPVPPFDLQVDQILADGTPLALAYAEAGGPTAFANTELAADDSIRVLGIVQGSPCAGLMLKAYRAEADTATTLDPVFLETPLDPSGLAFHETGSLLLTLEDTCGAVTASAHLTVSTDLSTGISTRTESGFNARYVNNIVLVDAVSGGLLQIRNVAGQLVQEAQLVKGTMHHSLPFSGEAGGIYIATLRGPSHVDPIRFAVY